MPVVPEREYRNLTSLLTPTAAEAHKRIDSSHYVEGYATTFNTPYLMWEYEGIKYYEVVDRGALTGADVSDVIMQYDHHGKVLARNGNKTLHLETDEHGLFIAADLSKSKAARDMYEEIGAGLITRMSMGFIVEEDSYDRATNTRTIMRFKRIYDVSAVSIPANGGTEIATRDYFAGVAEMVGREALERRRRVLQLILRTGGTRT